MGEGCVHSRPAAAGDLALGERFLDSIQPFVWRRSLDFGVIDEVRQISARIRDHFAQGAIIGPGYDLKRGRGGIREVEFFVQIQQMIYGGRDASVRVPATLDAVHALLGAGRLEEATARQLADAYRLLRTIEHRVQMVADAQTHLLPADPAALDNVAQLHGLADGESCSGSCGRMWSAPPRSSTALRRTKVRGCRTIRTYSTRS